MYDYRYYCVQLQLGGLRSCCTRCTQLHGINTTTPPPPKTSLKGHDVVLHDRNIGFTDATSSRAFGVIEAAIRRAGLLTIKGTRQPSSVDTAVHAIVNNEEPSATNYRPSRQTSQLLHQTTFTSRVNRFMEQNSKLVQ